ncbi:Basic 7S globulin 2 [Spatholobus suberectus]|nr:Basic 7S globulin 2 [Spatholobus suberectus]
MASFPLFIICLLCLITKLSHSHAYAESPVSFQIPATKDASTLQYLTTLSYGTPLVPTKLVLDLGGPFLWLHCASRNTPSSSSLTTPHRSLQCLTAKPDESASFLSTPLDEDQYQQPCQVFPENSITGTVAAEGELVQDLMALQSAEFKTIHEHQLRFTCSPTTLLHGLAKSARGMVGLGRSRTSLPSQVFDSFSTHRKLTLCLSSSKGVVLLGNVGPHQSDILKSLTFTPLVTGYPSHEYLINVSSVKINGKRLSLDTSSSESHEQGALTLLSSIVPYTTMHSSIYASFKTAFEDAALSVNMTKVPSVAPFELCFSTRGLQVGPSVPVIELVLQSEMVKWSIHGRNSMVRVSDEVLCLGFLDGGVNLRNKIVIGGYQLEDVIVQFDLATSMVGFSSSLFTKNTKCSDFKFRSMPAESI